MTLRTISDYDRLFLLDILTDPGHDLEYAAEAASLNVDTVRDIVSHHGWPDRAKIALAAKIVRGKIHREQTAGDGRYRQVDRPRKTAPPAPAETARKPAPVPARPEALKPAQALNGQHSPVLDLVKAGKASPVQSTRTLAARAELVLQQLADKLAADEDAERKRKAATEAAAKRKTEQAAARAEIARLERRLRDARAKLRGTPTTTETSSQRAKIREWALKQGISCPQYGKVPRAVREQYEVAGRP